MRLLPRRALPACFAAAAGAFACGGRFTLQDRPDAAADAGAPDANQAPRSDAGPVEGARPSVDSGVPGMPDAAVADGALPDATARDAATADTSTPPRRDAAADASGPCPATLALATGGCSAPNQQCAYAGANCTCVPSCEALLPRSCEQQGLQCGLASDTAGGILDCGTCPPPSVCQNNLCTGDSGWDHGCPPLTCAELGLTCGIVSDGCGGIIDCGYCAEWVCSPPGGGCPETEPEAGTPCPDGLLSCAYDPGPCGEATLQCTGGVWVRAADNQ